MGVIHILKNGSVVKDITGLVVKMDAAPALYQLIQEINARGIKKRLSCYEKSN